MYGCARAAREIRGARAVEGSARRRRGPRGPSRSGRRSVAALDAARPSRRVSAEPGGKERAFARVQGELQRAAVRSARLFGPAEGAQELRSRRVIQVVPVELFGEAEKLDVRLVRAVDMPERDRAIE